MEQTPFYDLTNWQGMRRIQEVFQDQYS